MTELDLILAKNERAIRYNNMEQALLRMKYSNEIERREAKVMRRFFERLRRKLRLHAAFCDVPSNGLTQRSWIKEKD